MNITQQNSTFALLIFVVFLFYVPVFAGEKNNAKNDSTFSITVEAGSGFTSNFNSEKKGFAGIHLSPSIRVYWRPNHLLDVGIEIAHIQILSKTKKIQSNAFGKTTYKASLSGIPVLFPFRMNFHNYLIKGGVGAAYVTSKIDAFHSKTQINYWYYCYYFAIGYRCRLTDKIEVGIELLSYSMPRIEQNLGGLHLHFSYDLFNW